MPVSLHSVEIEWILRIQQMADFPLFWRLVSFVGQEGLSGILLPIVYLAWNPDLGRRLFWLLAINSAVIEVLKVGLHFPRPFWVDKRIVAAGFLEGGRLGSYGFPSGHAGSATIFSLFFVHLSARKWVWIGALSLVFAMGLSRVCLGLHFISDVVGASIISALLGILILKNQSRMKIIPSKFRLGLVVLFSIAVVLAGRWLKNSADAGVSQAAPFLNAGILLGGGMGFSMIQARGGFDSGGTWREKLRRLVIFWSILGCLWVGRKVAAIPQRSPWHEPSLFCVGLAGSWTLTFLVPWLSLKLGFARRDAAELRAPSAELHP